MTTGSKAFTLVEMLVVIFVVAVIIALLLPTLARPKRSPGISCENHLLQIGLAFRVWEEDNGGKYPTQVSVTNGGAMELAAAGDAAGIFRTISNELSTPKILICPEDKKHSYATNFSTDFNNSKISYFVGSDADVKFPQMILAGDNHLAVNGTPVKSGILNLSTNASVEWTRERHHGAGNIVLVSGFVWSDGSIQNTTIHGLKQAFQQTGIATNKLVIP